MTDHVVIDSTCLIALERIDQLALIPQIFPSVIVPPGVQSEFGAPLNWLTIQPVKNSAIVETLKTQLDDGEAQAIALALELENVLLVLDDKKARRVAQQLEQITMLCSRPSFLRKQESSLPVHPERSGAKSKGTASGCRITSGMTQAYWHGYNVS